MAAKRIDVPSPTDATESVIRDVLMRIAGVRVGLVKSYDAVQGVANVQPVRRRRIFGTPTDEPLVSQAPVGWWRFGRMVFAGELEAGDEVLLVPSEREIRPWWLSGVVHDPQSERMFSHTDCVVLPWISSFKRPILARAARTFWMGREDGTAGIAFPMDIPARLVVDAGPLGIVLGSEAFQPALLGSSTIGALGAYATSITGACATLNTAAVTWGNTFPNTFISNGLFAGAFAAWASTIAAAQVALAANLTAALAVKVAVE